MVCRLQILKTARIPVHYAITKQKLRILEKLTARQTYGIKVWSKLFELHQLSGTYLDRSRFYHQVKLETGLPGHMVSCCFDISSTAWKSYKVLRTEWMRELNHAKQRGDPVWIQKLNNREPRKPFTKAQAGKIPVWFDNIIGSVERSTRIKLSSYVARISTLRRGMKLTIPLNPAKYHLDLLRRGKPKSFQIVKRSGRWFVHLIVEYDAPDQPVLAVRGIDLGLRRSVASVTLRADESLRSTDFLRILDGLKRHRLNELNRRSAELQRARKWEALKNLRFKRRRSAEYYDRVLAKQIASVSQGCLVVIGYPRGIKYQNYRGNGKRSLRRCLTHWSYERIIRYIREECMERGIQVESKNESWSSLTCHRCGSTDTERASQSLFHCWNCELWYNADFNAAINIGSPFLATPMSRTATVGLTDAGDEQASEACEPRNAKLKVVTHQINHLEFPVSLELR